MNKKTSEFISPLQTREIPSNHKCPVCDYLIEEKKPIKLSVTTLYRCCQCQVIFAWPDFHDPARDFYDIYHLNEWLKYYQKFRSRTHQKFLKNHQNLISNAQSVLEIGCSAGWFLDVIRRQNPRLKTVAVEPSPELLSRINKKHKTYRLCAEQIGQLEEQFDIIAIWNVFEHFKDPHQVLEMVKKKLNPEGLLMLSVPNRDGLISKLTYTLARFPAGRITWPLEELMQTDNAFGHLYHYNKRSLTFVLERNGFTPVIWEGADIIDTSNTRQRLKISSKTNGRILKTVLGIGLAQLTRIARVIKKQDEIIVISKKNDTLDSGYH